MKFSMTRVVLGADLDITEAQLDALLDAGLVLDAGQHMIRVDGKLRGAAYQSAKRHLRAVSLADADGLVGIAGEDLKPGDAIEVETVLPCDRFLFKVSPPGALTPDDETSNRSGFIPKAIAGKSEGGKP
jgi:hypothetical protein